MNKVTSKAIEKAIDQMMKEHNLTNVALGGNYGGYYCQVVDSTGKTRAHAFEKTMQDAFIGMQHKLAGTEEPPF